MSKTHRLLVLLGVFFLAGIAPRLAAQPVSSVTLSGTVVEAETGQPLEGASVFLANTLIGTTTDQNGFFLVTGVPLGTYDLVVSFVGFQAQTERLRLIQAGDLTVDFRLALRVVESSGGIEVTATSPKRWQRQYKTFEKFFLGISRNASKCEILNPEVLDFEVDEATGEFITRARAPLLIENRALGYRLRFVLEGFQLNEKKHLIRYRGRVGFTELLPSSDREAQRWAKRRLEAYNGSLRHFLASLVRDEVAGEGFMVVSEEDSREAAYSGVPGARPSARITTVRPENILGPGELDFERKLDFIGYLKILYFKEVPSSAYLKYREYTNRGLRASEDEQVSWISLNHPGVLFTTDGIVEDTYALTKFGYWYFERVAELLPYEYRPPGFMDVREALRPPDPALVLRPAFVKGVEAFEAEAYAEAVAHLAPVVAADPGYYLDERGSAAYWLGLAYAAREQEPAAQNTWFDGVQALRDQGDFDVRLADAYVRSVFRHENKQAYQPAAQAYLDLLEQADTTLSEEEHEIVLSHVAQMLPVLTDEERLRVMMKKDAGPLLQRLALQPGAGSFLATLWRTQDPLPASALNERVAEHLARVAYSLNTYAFSAARTGFDDRGKAYVQYGPPHTKVTIPIHLSRAAQAIRASAYPMPGALIPAVNEFWTYRHIDDLVYYLFVLEGGRYQESSPEGLVPRELRNAHKRLGNVGYADSRTLGNVEGEQSTANQSLAEALVEVWKAIYTQLMIYQPAFEEQVQELELHEADMQATHAVGASALSFVNTVDLKFTAMARQATLRRETEAPRTYSLISSALEQFPVTARIARFLDDDGSTRTELFWSHEPGSLALSKKIRKRVLDDPDAPPDRYLVEMVLNLHSEDYRERTPSALNYLAVDLPQGDAAPVQTLEIMGSTAPYHLSVQWDQFLVKIDEATGEVGQGMYLRTGTERLDGLMPLRSDPLTLEMSDLKPINLDESAAMLVQLTDDADEAQTPYPFATLTPETPLGLYFEVYHLTFGDDDRAHYTVEYEIVRDPDGRRVTLTSAQSPYTGASRKAEEFIALDLSEVGSARAIEIVVRVTDETTGQTVERAIPFILAR